METTVDRLLKKSEDAKKALELSSEESSELKKACQEVFSTREGKIVAYYMMKISGIYKFPDMNLEPLSMACQKGLCYMYKFFIKGMLDAKTIMEIETRRK